MNDLTAKDIAIAIDDIGRCPCGNTATAIFECESTDCGSNFCFLCMQKYIHGRTIIPYKLCEPHFHSEIKCMGLDQELEDWQDDVASTLSTISTMKSVLANSNGIMFFLLAGAVFMLVSGTTSLLEPMIDSDTDPMLGILLTIGAVAIKPFSKMVISSSESHLEDLISNIPDNNPPDRPNLPGRHIFAITNESVKDYLVSI